jgi:PAS domain S-box-containing protein
MTEQYRTQMEKYRGESEQFHVLVDTVTDYAIYMLDPDGRVTTWNIGAQRVKGYRAEEIIGENFSCFFVDEDRRAGRHLEALETAKREGRSEAQGWRVRRDGTRFWVNAVVYPVRDRAGELTGFVKVTRDITDRLRQEDMLERARSAAMQSQKMEAVGQLTGGVAHDFNNLLASILGTADLLSRRSDISDDVKSLISVIIRSAQRGASLTQRLLAFSRRQALEPHEVDLNRLVGNMSDLLRRTLGETISIETILAGGLWRTFIDGNQLESALLNLAINARDAMRNGGKLTIETGNTYLDDEYAALNAEVTAGQYLLVAVSDNGCGMSTEVAARAFEPFFTTKPEGRGTGLGLSQVYGFVKQSGGHIKIYSEPGKGTSIKVYIPRYLGAAEPEQPSRRHEVSLLGRGEKILVVDDDDEVREYLHVALTSLGYSALETHDAESALEVLAQQADIALLFTDLGLPGLNGRALADQARIRLPGLKVVYTTGYARNAIVHHGLVDPGVNLLPKPFTVETLGRKIRQVLET